MATLAEAVDAAETDWLVSADIPDTVDYLTVESEVVQVTATFPAQYQARDGSTSEPRIRVVRAAGGTTGASHADGTTLTPLIPPSAAGGGAAEAGTVVVTPPLEVDVSAALEGANAPDGSNPLATIADLTIAEVLSNGNTVADNQQILVPDGAQFDITGLTSPSPGIGWLPDGSLTMGSGTATIVFGADGVIMISAGNGGILTLDPDGSYSLLNGSSGLAVAADGKITLAMQGIGDVLAISATGDVEVNGSGVVKLNLPTAPGAAGELWADSGIVTVA